MNARFDNAADASGPRKVVALSGGIGGAKLALGLKQVLLDGALTVVANTGDDFVHMGLHVSPDIDTLVYTLAGINNPETGWGRAGETWSFMSAVETLGGEAWFKLGDGDLAMHVLRTEKLRSGETLGAITADVCRALSVGATIVPMSDQSVRTMLRSAEGWLEFQDYFVHRQAAPVVEEIAYVGAAEASPPAGLCELLVGDDVDAIVICPSNPLISVEPILAVPGIREAIRAASAPVVAVSPIIDGQAVKGPTAKMLRELGFDANATTVMQRYAGLIDAFVADPRDVPALLDAGRAALRLGDTDAALGFFRRADQVSPGNAAIKAQIGKALVRADKPVEAIGYYDDAERAGGDTTSFAGDRGLAYDLVGDNGTAQRWYKVALAHNSSDDEVRMRYALSLAIGGDERGANAVLSPLIQRQDRSAWRVRTFILAISGKEDEAVSIANATMPADLALAIAPYLRYMPRLTHAQQAAAANFGRFPRAADIGRDDESIRQYAATHPGMTRLAAAPTPPSGSPAEAVASGGGKRRQTGRGGEESATRLARTETPRPPAPVQTPPPPPPPMPTPAPRPSTRSAGNPAATNPPPQRQAASAAFAPQPAPTSLLPAPAPQPARAAQRPAPSSAPGSDLALIDKPSASVATPSRAAPPPPSDGPADFSSAFDSFHVPASEKRRTEAAVNLNKFTRRAARAPKSVPPKHARARERRRKRPPGAPRSARSGPTPRASGCRFRPARTRVGWTTNGARRRSRRRSCSPGAGPMSRGGTGSIACSRGRSRTRTRRRTSLMNSPSTSSAGSFGPATPAR